MNNSSLTPKSRQIILKKKKKIFVSKSKSTITSGTWTQTKKSEPPYSTALSTYSTASYYKHNQLTVAGCLASTGIARDTSASTYQENKRKSIQLDD